MNSGCRQVVVASGKGGTGKTTVLASWGALARRPLLADCDVDAPNLYLLLRPEARRQEDFWGAQIAVRDPERCTQCGECEARCRFGAITREEVSESRCEGCGLCVLVCPQDALRLETVVNGRLFVGATEYGPLVHARLLPAAENSGRLVSEVRRVAESLAREESYDLMLLDGPPGIGCTAASSLVDTDLAVFVTEPTLSGMHDLERVLRLSAHFRVPAAVIVNRADLNADHTARLRGFCREHDLPLLAELPFDETVVAANAACRPLVEFDPTGPVSQGLTSAWGLLLTLLDTLP